MSNISSTTTRNHLFPSANAACQFAIQAIGYGIIVGLSVFFFVSYYKSSRMAPFVDDWVYVAALEMQWIEKIKWFLAQHVDHRIPLQKILQYYILIISNFDFRVLIAINIVLCAVISGLFMDIARLVRGSQSIGDWIFPTLLLSPFSGPSLWGFQFQFLSSVLFLTVATHASVKYIQTGKTIWAASILFACILDALCGLNGLLTATIFITGLIIMPFFLRAHESQLSSTFRWACFGITVFCILLWLNWKPSPASNVSLDLNLFAAYAFNLYGSIFGFYSFGNSFWLSSLVMAFAVAALGFSTWVILRGVAEPLVLLPTLSLIATCLLGFAIAAGRSKIQGNWDPAIGMHYSFLMIPVMFYSWIILSARSGWVAHSIAGILLIWLCTAAYTVNACWRFEHVAEVGDKRAQLALDLKRGVPSDSIAAKYITEMMADKTRLEEVQYGLAMLRQHGFWRYGGKLKKTIGGPP